jgi:uncharacterized protein involved in response to NO
MPVSLLSYGFRPFFLLAAGWAALALGLFLAALEGALALPSAMDPVTWHKHEMLFGFVVSAMAGFLLTAVPNWTGRLPLKGRPLGALALLWLAGRAAVFGSAWWDALPAAIVDAAFLWVLAGVIAREVIRGNNRHNLVVCALIALLATANTWFHASYIATGDTLAATRLTIAGLALLVALIGGRITPSFTRNWLVKQGATRLPVPMGTGDRVALVALALALAAWVIPSVPPVVAGGLLVAAGCVHAWRQVRWRPLATWREPLLLVLHLGYAWLPAGLVLLGLERLGLAGGISALHALTAGLFATMIVAVMTRASLGHSGRDLHAGPATVAIYALVISGALLRVALPAFGTGALAWLVPGALWGGGMLVFVLAYGPMLARRRA